MHEKLEAGRNHIAVDVMACTVRAGELTLLLSRRSAPPFEGCWALPGRFIGLDESAETGVRKLLNEMLPAADAYMEQLYTFTALNRDPRGRVISVAYLLILPWEQLEPILAQDSVRLKCFGVRQGAEAKGLQLISPDGTLLTGGDLAFDHGEIIRTGVARLQGKIDYTDVGFHFLGDMSAFSLGEMQTVFEAVMGKPMDASNFRRWIRNRYEETGRIVQTAQAKQQGRGRPAVLYRFVE